jgi:RND family efflux transporter MFP subunit
VDSFNLTEGMTLKQHAAVAHVLKIDPILVKMDFPQERLGEVAIGQEAEVILDSFQGQTFQGKVERIVAHVDTHLRVLPVYIRLDNADHRLRPGITGFARIKSTKVARVVPATAVISRGNKNMVFRIEDGRARIREVQTGAAVGTGMLEVRSGLADGDEVVIYCTFYNHFGTLTRDVAYLEDNDPVDADWRKWARRD